MNAKFIPYDDYIEYSVEEMRDRAKAFYVDMKRRRTVRDFSDRAVPQDIIEQCILAAGSAPNGANLQPWQFVVVTDSEIKKQIREAAEEEEQAFYAGRAPEEWLAALAPLGTDATKEFLTTAPYLIAIFAKSYDVLSDGTKVKNYYAQESVGLATGILITALHHVGLATLTHTPSPMGFLNHVLNRPKNERPFLLLIVGYPDDKATIPHHATQKKSLNEIVQFT